MKYIGMNGTIVPQGKAMVSVMDHGFLYGMGLFETFRTYGGVPFLLDQHLDRLREGCKSAGILGEVKLERERIETLIHGLMEANGLQEAYIRYTLTAGEAPFGLHGEPYTEPTEVIYVKALPPLSDELYTKGKALYVLQTPRNTPEGNVRLKSLHYMNNILAKQELAEAERQYGSSANPRHLPAEGLMLTSDGKLAEGIVSNLFLVANGQLLTPSINTGILPGITRGLVLEEAGKLGWITAEGRFDRELLFAAEEIFMTNSVQELTPVTRLVEPYGRTTVLGGGEAGPFTRKLLERYRKRTGGYNR